MEPFHDKPRETKISKLFQVWLNPVETTIYSALYLLSHTGIVIKIAGVVIAAFEKKWGSLKCPFCIAINGHYSSKLLVCGLT